MQKSPGILVTVLTCLIGSSVIATEKRMAPVSLPKKGFIHISVLDSNKKMRQFLVTCELELETSRVQPLRQLGHSHMALKSGGTQSLISYWNEPATDYVVTCDKSP